MARGQEGRGAIQSNGIRVNGCFILGLDGQGPEIFDRVLEFSMETGLFDVQITVQTPFPGTPLYSRLKTEGRLLHDDAWQMCTLFDVNFRPQQMSVEELRRGFRNLGEKIYSSELTETPRRFRRTLPQLLPSLDRGSHPMTSTRAISVLYWLVALYDGHPGSRLPARSRRGLSDGRYHSAQSLGLRPVPGPCLWSSSRSCSSRSPATPFPTETW